MNQDEVVKSFWKREVRDLFRRAGDVALDLQKKSHPRLKHDNSVVTDADLQISQIFQQGLSGMKAQGHLLIDEEVLESQQGLTQAVLESHRYIWVLDPIDGTLAYANGMSFYGISLGVLKDLKPWLGGVYFPSVGEFFVSDGDETHFIEKAFSSQETSQRITPVDQEINRQTFFFATESFFKKYKWDHSLCLLMSVPSAVSNLCWPAVGRGVGCLFDASLWDFVGSWAVFEAAGLRLHNISTGEPLEKIHTDLFMGTEARPWRVKEKYILSSSRNFPIIAKNL
ncbi:MAG: hypothetical protein NUV91_07025 [Candidatus Omnitrophica bacterium]|nr:hypothetical protein [Candidatus Omnitrophota bacterium]